MEALVIDSNVLVASFLEFEERHDDARRYITALENGDFVFHLPTLVPVEVMSAIWRRTQKQGMAFLIRATRSLRDWESTGKLVLYSLDSERMEAAIDATIKYRLSGSDSIIASLADELDIGLATFDSTLQIRVPRASP